MRNGEKNKRREGRLGGADAVGPERIAGTIKIDFEGTLGSVQNEPTILALFKVRAERRGGLRRERTFEVVADCADCSPAGHDSPQGVKPVSCRSKRIAKSWFFCMLATICDIRG
jgi:hypothetical protein